MLCLGMSGCATTVTTTTLPDGTMVIVKATKPDQAAIDSAVGVSVALFPILVHSGLINSEHETHQLDGHTHLVIPAK